MAKIAFSKFGLKSNSAIVNVEWAGQMIEVTQYLPVQEKLGLIGRVISQAHEEDNNYSNPVKVQVYFALEVVFAYTNITFTDKQKEDLPKLFDLLTSSGLLNAIINAIPADEFDYLSKGVKDSIAAVYAYQNSVLGILQILKGDMDGIEEKSFDIENLKKELMELSDSDTVKNLTSLFGLN